MGTEYEAGTACRFVTSKELQKAKHEHEERMKLRRAIEAPPPNHPPGWIPCGEDPPESVTDPGIVRVWLVDQCSRLASEIREGDFSEGRFGPFFMNGIGCSNRDLIINAKWIVENIIRKSPHVSVGQAPLTDRMALLAMRALVAELPESQVNSNHGDEEPETVPDSMFSLPNVDRDAYSLAGALIRYHKMNGVKFEAEVNEIDERCLYRAKEMRPQAAKDRQTAAGRRLYYLLTLGQIGKGQHFATHYKKFIKESEFSNKEGLVARLEDIRRELRPATGNT